VRNSHWSFWKRAFVTALIVGPSLAFITVDAEARRGGGGGGHGGRGGGHGGGPAVRAPRGNVGGGRPAARPPGNRGGGGYARPARPPAPVHGAGARPRPPGHAGPGGGWAGRPPVGGPGGPRPVGPRPGGPPPGGPRPPPPRVEIDHYWGAPIGAAAVAVGTAIAVGAIVSSLPPGCRTVVVNGDSYRQCGSTYYAPRYDGSTVVYEVVSSPY
jgi:hypothetical protein